MTPQSNFMVHVPIRPDKRGELEALLASMNFADAPGMANPENGLFPFGEFDTVHYARFVIIDDQTLVDFRALGLPTPKHPVTLTFLGECDGPAEKTLAEFASHEAASSGLKKVFSHCEEYSEHQNLLSWMKSHSITPAAAYTNWLGRTVKRARQESHLYDALRRELINHANGHGAGTLTAKERYNHLQNFVSDHPELLPDKEAPTPLAFK